MQEAFKGLKPEALWHYFDKILAIPHCSKKEEKLRRWILDEAKAKGAKVTEDATGNIVIEVEATKGYEQAPVVILQGHIDMVCEKNSETRFDFDTEGIRALQEGEWITADKTTLGADNGIGIAAALACLADDSLVHPKLELLFTIDEETGLTGAMGLDPSLISGKILLNMDSEEDGMLYVGCAGGRDVSYTLPLSYEAPPVNAKGAKLVISGLMGGHSGCDIHQNRANAIKALAKALHAFRQRAIKDGFQIGVESMKGGSAHNAIPREASATLALAEQGFHALEETLTALTQELKREFPTDMRLALTLERADAQGRALTIESEQKAVDMLLGFHSGVFAMSRDIENLVETSNNLSIIETKADALHILNATRSSVDEGMESLLGQNDAVARLAGAKIDRHEGYPGWRPNMDSKLLGLMRGLFVTRYGKEPKITAIHAGLECGIIGENIADIDMVSFGPEIDNPHSPDEKVWIPSVERFWQMLADTLEAIAKGKL